MFRNEFADPTYLEEREYDLDPEYSRVTSHVESYKPVEVQTLVLAESYKAFLIEVKRVRFWVPKSLIMSRPVPVPGTSGAITVPKFLLTGKGVVV